MTIGVHPIATQPIASYVEASSNTPSTGELTFTGTQHVGFTLTMDTSNIADADGLGAFTYVWLRNDVVIAGATSSSYTLVLADLTAVIKPRAIHTDGGGTEETITGAGSHPIAAAPSLPASGGAYRSCNGTLIVNSLFVEGTETFEDYPLRVQNANFLATDLFDGGSDSAQMAGGNLEIYSDSGFTNRVAIAITIFDTTNNLIDFKALMPTNSPVIGGTLYWKVVDPATLQPAYSGTYGADAVNGATTLPAGTDLDATLVNNNDDTAFVAGAQVSCVNVPAVTPSEPTEYSFLRSVLSDPIASVIRAYDG